MMIAIIGKFTEMLKCHFKAHANFNKAQCLSRIEFIGVIQ